MNFCMRGDIVEVISWSPLQMQLRRHYTVPLSSYPRTYLGALHWIGCSLKRPPVDAEPPDVLSDLSVDGRDDGGRQKKGQGRRHYDVNDGGSAGAVVPSGREPFAAAAVVSDARTVEVERKCSEDDRRRPDGQHETLGATAGHDEPQRVDDRVEPVDADGDKDERRGRRNHLLTEPDELARRR